MSFWGIEVKPGKPVKHSYDKVQRRLRISQATLGIGSATKTSFVQCNIGKKHPVFLCALLPDKTESCHLDLEFEEPDDVVFSVLGPRSVYLTGYYVNNRTNANFGSDTESYGEDIGYSESEKSGIQTDDDEYDDSFIDDDDPVVSPASPSPSPASSGRDVEKLKHTKKTKEKNGTHNPQRRKFLVVDSDDNASSQDSGEDNYLLSVFKNKKAAKASASEGDKMEPVFQETVQADDKKEKADFVNKHRGPESEPGSVKKKKLKRKRKEESDDLESLGGQEVKAQQADAGADGQLHDLPSQQNKKPTSYRNSDGCNNLTQTAEVSSGNKRKPKKRSKVGDVEQIPSDHNDGASSENVIEHPHNVIEKAGKITQNLQKVEDKKATAERDANPDLVVDGGNIQKAKKKKKKGKSNENNETLNTGGSPLADNMIREPKAVDVRNCDGISSSQVRTLSNGLVVEDLSFGDKDGKVAASGKKVKVFYKAMLKENGQVLDSNFGKIPYRFRLGDEGILEGWNVGLEGMRAGDKRRLTIPPAMGYGSEGAGENIPPNSWLVYDVELVRVR